VLLEEKLWGSANV